MRKIEKWFSSSKSGGVGESASVGELPEATNESQSEDIIAPFGERCPRKLNLGEG
jgi:hypothetical protein